MQMLLSRLADEDDASHLLEYSLLAAGVAAAISEPYLFVAAFYRFVDVVALLVSQVNLFF